MLEDAIDLQRVASALVIKLRHHGDVLLSSPVLSVLKRHAPHVRIDALVYRDTAEMLALHPALDRLHTVDRAWRTLPPLARLRAERTLLDELRGRRYDLIVHLTEHPRGAWLARLLGPRYSVARLRGGRLWRRSFSHLYPLPRSATRHTVECDLDALRRLGIQPGEGERGLTLVPGTEAQQAVDALLAGHGLRAGEYVHFHPASRWQFKCWPDERCAGLLDALHARGLPLVLTGAPDPRERAQVARIVELAKVPALDLAGQLSLKQLAALSARARLFVGVDSAPMHMACAVGTPVVALFGPSGELEWGPWRTPHRLVTSRHPCRPCGRDGCGGGKISECLTTIPVDQVLAATLELLDETAGGRAGPAAV